MTAFPTQAFMENTGIETALLYMVTCMWLQRGWCIERGEA